MEENKNVKKETPVKKDDAKKKVEALKKQKEQAKEKKELNTKAKLAKLDEKEIPEYIEKVDISWDGLTKDIRGNIKKIFQNIVIFFKNIGVSFSRLDTSIKICIVVPLAILLVVIGNRIYSESEKTYLNCTYTSYSSSIKITQDLKLVFKEGRLYTQTSKTKYEILKPEVKTLGQLETEKRDSNEELNGIKGVSAKYTIKDGILYNEIEYNFYKLSLDDIKNLSLDKDSSLNEFKERLEGFEYTCKSDE